MTAVYEPAVLLPPNPTETKQSSRLPFLPFSKKECISELTIHQYWIFYWLGQSAKYPLNTFNVAYWGWYCHIQIYWFCWRNGISATFVVVFRATTGVSNMDPNYIWPYYHFLTALSTNFLLLTILSKNHQLIIHQPRIFKMSLEV